MITRAGGREAHSQAAVPSRMRPRRLMAGLQRPLFRLLGTYPFSASDHRLAWLDVRLAGPQAY